MVLSKKNILLLFEDPKFKDILINNVVVFENEVVIDITININLGSRHDGNLPGLMNLGIKVSKS